MARKIEVEIVGDSRSLERAFKRSESSAKSFNHTVTKSRGGGGLISMAKLATGALGITGLAGAAHAAFQEMQSAQQVTAQTEAVLKSTGGAANVTAKHVDALANSMLRKTGIDDEAIKTSENMLLTFRDVRNEVGKGNNIFDQATQSVADMATAMNKGATPSAEQLQQASIRLGKALNDPVKGAGALARVGVQLDSRQKQLIKDLVEGRKAADNLGDMYAGKLSAAQTEQMVKLSKLGMGWQDVAKTIGLEVTPAQRKLLDYWAVGGHKMEAQKIILKELKNEFGGAANAAGKTLGGQLNVLRESLMNLGGSIAQTLSPQIEKVVGQMVKWLNNSKNQKTVLETVKQITDALGETLRVLVGIFRALNKITGSTRNTVLLLGSAFAALKVARLASQLRGAIAATSGLKGALGGKAGLYGAALAAGYGIGQLLNKIPAVQRAEKWAGATGYSAAAKLGLVRDPMKQYAGKTIPTPAIASFVRARGARLVAGGLTGEQAAQRILATHQNLAISDVRKFVAMGAPRGGVVVHGDVHVHGVQDIGKLEHQLTKRAKARAHVRRGT